MASTSSNSSSGGSTSNSNPTTVQTPQSEWALQLSQLLGALSQNQYNWAMQQFNNGMGVTNDQINNYMNLAGMGAGLAQNLLGRYVSTFEPLMNNFIQQAGSYNSADRQKFMMGQAESTAAQADKAAMDSAASNLQSFGINPNSGRYQDLLTANRMQDAATRAGAGTQASVNTAAIGRQMQQQAVQMGQNLPGMTVNALQSAYTGVTGAVNAENAMLNTGANLTNTAANFGNAAANANKLPPVGQVSTSQSHQVSGGSSQSTDPPQKSQQKTPSNSAGQRGSGSGSQGTAGNVGAGGDQHKDIDNPYFDPNKNNDDGSGDDNNTFGGTQFGNADPGAMLPNSMGPWEDPNKPGSGASGMGPWMDPNAPIQPNTFDGQNQPGMFPDQQPQDQGQPSTFDQQNQPGMFPDQGPQTADSNPQQSSWWNPTSTVNAGGMPSGPGQAYPGDNFDWAQGQGQGPQGQGPQDQSQYGQYANTTDQLAQDQSNMTQAQDSWDQQPQGQYGGQYQPQSQGGDYSAQGGGTYSGGQYTPPSDSGFTDTGSTDSGGYYGGYARGGKVQARGMIPMRGRQSRPTSGGPVPRNASPSRGRQTDDVPARLNAGEFVIPKDVTAHMGTKHFQDVIAKSRKLRTGMAGPPARPKPKPALRMRPTFTSHYLGAR